MNSDLFIFQFSVRFSCRDFYQAAVHINSGERLELGIVISIKVVVKTMKECSSLD